MLLFTLCCLINTATVVDERKGGRTGVIVFLLRESVFDRLFLARVGRVLEETLVVEEDGSLERGKPLA